MRAPLLLCVALVGCGHNSITGPPPEPSDDPVAVVTEPAWRQDRGDLLNWFLGHQPDGSGLRSAKPYVSPAGGVGLSALSLTWDGSQHSGHARYGKGPQSFLSWEHYRWDAEAVYLVEDHGRNGDTYGFSRGPWFSRRAKVGAGGRAVGNVLQRYDDRCRQVESAPWQYEWRYTAQGRADFGGVVGVQDYIVISYIWGTGREERYFYTWDWGWVRHQYVQDGAIHHDYTMNLLGPTIDFGEECK